MAKAVKAPEPKADLVLQTTKERLKQEVALYKSQTEEAIATANKIVIQNDDDEKMVADVRAKIKTLGNSIDATRKMLVDPHRAVVDAVNGELQPMIKSLTGADDTIKAKITSFRQAKQDAINRENERIRKEAEAKEKQRLIEQMKSGGDMEDAPPAPVPQYIPPAPKTTVGDGGGKISERKTWTFKVTDLSKVPLEYMMLNEKMVKAAVSSGKRGTEIPGIEIYQESKVI